MSSRLFRESVWDLCKNAGKTQPKSRMVWEMCPNYNLNTEKFCGCSTSKPRAGPEFWKWLLKGQIQLLPHFCQVVKLHLSLEFITQAQQDNSIFSLCVLNSFEGTNTFKFFKLISYFWLPVEIVQPLFKCRILLVGLFVTSAYNGYFILLLTHTKSNVCIQIILVI